MQLDLFVADDLLVQTASGLTIASFSHHQDPSDRTA